MKKIMHFLTIMIIAAGTLCVRADNVKASEVYATNNTRAALVDFKVENNDGWRLLTKEFEASPDYEPDFSLLIEEPFEFDGYYYTFYYASISEVMREERKWERTEVNFPIEEDDLAAVYKQLAPSIPYEQDGFSGWLDLDYTAVWTQIEGYTQKSFTMTDTVTIAGLSSNDSSQIEKTRVKSGVTLKLQSVDWTVQESTNIGYDTVPTKYTATAKYSGSYTKKVPTGYLARALYGGNVVRVSVDKVLYTVSYAGVSLASPEPETAVDAVSETPVPALEPVPEQTVGIPQDTAAVIASAEPGGILADGTGKPENKADELPETGKPGGTVDTAGSSGIIEAETHDESEEPSADKNNSFVFTFAVTILVLAFAAAAVIAYIRLNNVRIYAGDGKDFKQIARRRLNCGDPNVAIVDLRSLNLKSGKVTVFVDGRAAVGYHGKKIKTVISSDYSHFQTVNHKNRDLRYTVTIPEADAESGGDSKA